LFVAASGNDSAYVAGVEPTNITTAAYYNWYVCWQYLTGYYYQSIGWAQSLPPQNPTCQAVTITQVLL
jgi:hypothetical protein